MSLELLVLGLVLRLYAILCGKGVLLLRPAEMQWDWVRQDLARSGRGRYFRSSIELD